jgi:hypothetical protein
MGLLVLLRTNEHADSIVRSPPSSTPLIVNRTPGHSPLQRSDVNCMLYAVLISSVQSVELFFSVFFCYTRNFILYKNVAKENKIYNNTKTTKKTKKP